MTAHLRDRLRRIDDWVYAFAWCLRSDRAPREDDLALFAVGREGTLAVPARALAGPLELFVAAGSPVTPTGGVLCVEVLDAADALRFHGVPAGEDPSPATWALTERSIEVPTAGDSTGVIRLAAVAGSPFDSSIRYFFGKPGALERLVYPIFDGDGDGDGDGHGLRVGAVAVTLDPSRPHDAERTRIGAGAPNTYRTNFRSPLGHPITLTTTAESAFAYQYDPVTESAYSVIEGPWTVGVMAAAGATALPEADVLCGLSGLEYGKVAPAGHMLFRSGGPAFAQYFDRGDDTVGLTGLVGEVMGVEWPVTTSWVTFTDRSGRSIDDGPMGLLPIGVAVSALDIAAPPSGYYTQPELSPFYEVTASDPDFLSFMQIRAGNFPANEATFPLVPYAGVDPLAESGFDQYRAFERHVLLNARRAAILDPDGSRAGPPQGPVGLNERVVVGATGSTGATAAPCHGATAVGPTGPAGPTGPTHRGVTPKGLLAEFDPGTAAWRNLTLAQAESGAQLLQITEIEPELRKALLANQLFLVATDCEALLDACSVRYQLDWNAFQDLLEVDEVPSRIVYSVWYLKDFVYESLEYFDAVLRAGLGDCFDVYGDKFRKRAAKARLVISDWTFDLSPYLWGSIPGKTTYLIVKFADRPLEALVDDLGLWTGQGRFLTNETSAEARRKAMIDAQKDLRAIIADAKQKAQSGVTDFEYFATTVASSEQRGGGVEAWNGFLCLNCTVPLTQLPTQLQGLAAGINPAEFFAHHVGITASTVRFDPGFPLGIRDSSLFGLIYYEDDADLYYTEGHPYQFKVLSLKVLFANSQITNFSSRIELLVGLLFGERSSIHGGQHGDNLVLNGVWQRHGGVDSYSFTQDSKSVFSIDSWVLDSVEISQAQFVTLLPSARETVRTRFVFWGELRFRALEGFDVFSFGFDVPTGKQGGLRFSNLAVTMEFDPRTLNTNPPVFGFSAQEVGFDLALSSARPSSLYGRFPLRLAGLVQGSAGNSPGSLGFIQVRSPLQSGGTSDVWFGLTMELSLGSPGGLAAKAGFFATLIAAWSPSADDYQVYVGIKLPGSTSARKEITIEGPLKLKMADILFRVLNGDDPGKEAYMLQFYAISLSFLGVGFPPGGKTNVLLFGDPDPESAHSTLGWYAAYAKDKSAKGDNGDGGDGSALRGLPAGPLLRLPAPPRSTPIRRHR